MDKEVIRPPWPCFRWSNCRVESDKTVKSDITLNSNYYITLESENTKDVPQKHTVLNSDKNEPLNGLQTFLHGFDKDLEVYETEQGRAIEKEINDIMESLVSKIEEKDPRLKPCRLIKAGSVAEGTKVGKMDEFDFLIVINSLHVFSDFIELFLEEIEESISSKKDWDFMDYNELKQRAGCSIATKIHLRSAKADFNVDIDVCISFNDIVGKRSHGLWYNEIFYDVFDPIRRSIVMYPVSDCGIWDFDFISSITDFEKFFIITDVEHVKLKRIAIPQLELFPFLKCGRQSGQVKTYRYVKCIARNFFPKVLFNGYCICHRCDNCILYSYLLKTIILYMMENHKDPSLWSEANIPNRVIEVFDILAKGISNTNMELRGNFFSSFTTPDILCLPRLRFQGLRVSSPGGNPAEGLVTFYPEYTERLKTDNTKINEIIKSYFEYQRPYQSAYFESQFLIFMLRDMLLKLKEV